MAPIQTSYEKEWAIVITLGTVWLIGLFLLYYVASRRIRPNNATKSNTASPLNSKSLVFKILTYTTLYVLLLVPILIYKDRFIKDRDQQFVLSLTNQYLGDSKLIVKPEMTEDIDRIEKLMKDDGVTELTLVDRYSNIIEGGRRNSHRDITYIHKANITDRYILWRYESDGPLGEIQFAMYGNKAAIQSVLRRNNTEQYFDFQ